MKILDFGISKFDPDRTGEAGLTRDGSVMGTPWYMPPEQVRGNGTIDARADVYALGVVLYECVTGKRPFEAQQLAELAVKIHEGAVAPPSTLAAVQHDVDELVARAMHKDRERRFQSAAGLATAIEELGRRRGGMARGEAGLVEGKLGWRLVAELRVEASAMRAQDLLDARRPCAADVARLRPTTCVQAARATLDPRRRPSSSRS